MLSNARTTDLIETRFPNPVAVLHWKYRNHDEDDWQGRMRLLSELFEVVLRLLTSISVKAFLFQGLTSKVVTDRLVGFTRPSNGHWLELLRESIRQQSSDNALTIARLLHVYLFQKAESESSPYHAAEALVRALSLDQRITERVAWFDVLVAFRNKKIGHGSSGSEIESREFVGQLEPMLSCILQSLDFIAEYPLIHVREVKVTGGEFEHVAISCTGKAMDRRTFRATSPLDDNQIYVCHFPSADAEPDFALSLSPFVVLEHCEKCKSLQLFFLNKAEGKRIEFLSYQCGHTLEPPSYSSDLHDLRDFLLGRVPLKSLFERRGWAGRGSKEFVAPSGRDREIAQRLLDLGEASLRDGRSEDAISFLRKAIPLDPDADRGHFLLGTALLYREDAVDEAVAEFGEAGRLNPGNSLAFLALGNIARQSGDFSTARDMFLRAHEADPGDAEITAALADLDGVQQPTVEQRSDSE